MLKFGTTFPIDIVYQKYTTQMKLTVSGHAQLVQYFLGILTLRVVSHVIFFSKPKFWFLKFWFGVCRVFTSHVKVVKNGEKNVYEWKLYFCRLKLIRMCFFIATWKYPAEFGSTIVTNRNSRYFHFSSWIYFLDLMNVFVIALNHGRKLTKRFYFILKW